MSVINSAPTPRLTLISDPLDNNSPQIEISEANAEYVSKCANTLSKAEIGGGITFPVELNGKTLHYSVKRKLDNQGQQYLDLNETKMGVLRWFKQFFLGETEAETQSRIHVQNVLTNAVKCYGDKKAAINHRLNEKCQSVYKEVNTPDKKPTNGFPAVLYPSQCIIKCVENGKIDKSKPLILMLDLDENLTAAASRNRSGEPVPKDDIYGLDSELPEVIKRLKQQYQQREISFKLVLLTNSFKDQGQVEDKLKAAGLSLADFDHAPLREKREVSQNKKQRAKDILDKITDEDDPDFEPHQYQVMYFDDNQGHLEEVKQAASEQLGTTSGFHGFQTLAHLPVNKVSKLTRPEGEQPEADDAVNIGSGSENKAWKVTKARLLSANGRDRGGERYG